MRTVKKKKDWAFLRSEKLVFELTGFKDMKCKNGASLTKAIAAELRKERSLCASIARMMNYTTPANVAIALEHEDAPTKLIEMRGKLCKRCGIGRYKECSVFDDLDCKLTCPECHSRVDAVQKKPTKKK